MWNSSRVFTIHIEGRDSSCMSQQCAADRHDKSPVNFDRPTRGDEQVSVLPDARQRGRN